MIENDVQVNTKSKLCGIFLGTILEYECGDWGKTQDGQWLGQDSNLVQPKYT
jgi:hypothetical protein